MIRDTILKTIVQSLQRAPEVWCKQVRLSEVLRIGQTRRLNKDPVELEWDRNLPYQLQRTSKTFRKR